MKLTGSQARAIAEISDGAEVTLTRAKGQGFVEVLRNEDGLTIRVQKDGAETVLRRCWEEAPTE